MSLIGLLILLLVAAILGSIGASLAGHSSGGCLTSIALGFIGALLGSYISQAVGIRDVLYFHGIPIIWSIIGSAIFVALLNLLSGGKRRT
ncbi:GlsB/YeaQ/YmgE family stress response membrane protein [candidate division KSB1 bacterium]|jgi:uncharacterized membrane protein YeaQ/YmgE (transglycosylase-associated protein family)|nr:GlsB/YeaQ/YmgE family stress response membrane protein [candidate division KSB1 bacterium]